MSASSFIWRYWVSLGLTNWATIFLLELYKSFKHIAKANGYTATVVVVSVCLIRYKHVYILPKHLGNSDVYDRDYLLPR